MLGESYRMKIFNLFRTHCPSLRISWAINGVESLLKSLCNFFPFAELFLRLDCNKGLCIYMCFLCSLSTILTMAQYRCIVFTGSNLTIYKYLFSS